MDDAISRNLGGSTPEPGALFPETTVAGARAFTDRITIETALYASVFGVALFLRLFRIGLAPLSETEAAQAVSALHGAALPAGGSPLLYAFNSVLLSLFSPSDTIVRLVPALAGSAFVLIPALFRDALGRGGALGASIILALSPVALVVSRSLDGAVIAVGCLLISIALARRYMSEYDERHLFGAAIALGTGLASGSEIYTGLAALAASWLVLRLVLKDEGVRGLLPGLAELPRRSTLAAVAAVTFVLVSTGGLTRPAGLAAAGDLFAAWLQAFGSAGGSPAFDIVQTLIVYELLVLVAGMSGLSRALLRADRLGSWVGFGAIISMAIVILQTGRQPIDLLTPVALLALLAAYAIDPWAEATRARAAWTADGVLLAIGAVIAGVALLALRSYVRTTLLPVTVGPVVLQPIVVVLGMLIVLPSAIGVLLSTVYNVSTLLRSTATLGLILLALGSFAAGWGATQVRPGDAREIVLGSSVTSMDVRALVTTAEQIAVRAQGHQRTLPIRVEMDDPVLAWYFRDAAPPQGGPPPSGVVTLFGQGPQAAEADYIGARFVTRETWDTLGLNLDTWLEWVMFRTAAAEPPLASQAVTLWEKK